MSDPMRLNQMRDQKAKATDDLLRVLRLCIPSGWTAAVLELDVAYSPLTQTRAIKHQLFNPLSGEIVTDFPESLFQSVTSLHVISTELNEPWIRAIVTIPEPKPGGRLYEISYAYGPG